MKSDSKTAQLAAAHRAYHFEHCQPPVLEDSFARELLQPPLRTVLNNGLLRWLFWRPLFNKVQPISTFVVVRSRMTEDLLDEAIKGDIHQYVVLGAGLDSWSIRNHFPKVVTYELDHPDTQAMKLSSLRASEIAPKSQVKFVPIDFESESIRDVLANQSFDTSEPCFVSWLGTICYLTSDAINQTFESLAKICAPGSQIVFDYFLPESLMNDQDARFFRMLNEGGTKRGEPMISFQTPDEIKALMEANGFEVSEDFDAKQITERYLANRDDGLSIPGFVQLCHATKQ